MWRLTGAGNDRNLAEQTEDLRTKQRTVPNCQELVEENLCAGKWFLVRWVLLETEWVCCRRYVESRFSKKNRHEAHLEKVLCGQQFVQKLNRFLWLLKAFSVRTEKKIWAEKNKQKTQELIGAETFTHVVSNTHTHTHLPGGQNQARSWDVGEPTRSEHSIGSAGPHRRSGVIPSELGAVAETKGQVTSDCVGHVGFLCQWHHVALLS